MSAIKEFFKSVEGIVRFSGKTLDSFILEKTIKQGDSSEFSTACNIHD